MTTTAPVRLTRKSPSWFSGLPNKLSEAANNYKLYKRPDWEPLRELSNNTQFEGIEVYGDSSVAEENELVAPATVYVRLSYGESASNTDEFVDSYPARVFYSVSEDKEVKVHRIEVDTRTFYE